MGILRSIVKKVALAAVVVAGKRILSKVVNDVVDGDKSTTEPVVPVAENKPKTSTTSRRRTASRAKPGTEKTKADGKPAAKPRSRKPRAKTSEQTQPEEAKPESAGQSAADTTANPPSAE